MSTAGLFDEWFNEEFKYANPGSSAQVRALKKAYEAGYSQRASEDSEDSRILRNFLSTMRIDPE